MTQATLSSPVDLLTPISFGPVSLSCRFKQLLQNDLVCLPRFQAQPHSNPFVGVALSCPDLLLVKYTRLKPLQQLLSEFTSQILSQHERLLVVGCDRELAYRAAECLRKLGTVACTTSSSEPLPATLADIGSHELGIVRVENWKNSLSQTIVEYSTSLERWKSVFPIFSQLRRLAIEIEAAQSHVDRLRCEQEQITDWVIQQAQTPGSSLYSQLEQIPEIETFPQVQSKREQLTATQKSLMELQQLREQKKNGRLGFFRNLFVGDVETQVKELETQLATIQKTLDRAREEQQQHNEALRQSMLHEASNLRSQEFRREIQNSLLQEENLTRQFQELASRIEQTGLIAPNQWTSDAVTDALCAAESTIQLTEEKHLSACESLQVIESDTEQAVGRILGRMRVVVATADALNDRAVQAAPFDRVVVLDAHEMSDASLMDTLTHADRWIVCGQAQNEGSQLLHRAWSELHRPNWLRENGRLVCRMVHERLSELHSESLADKPEIGIQFGTRDDGSVVLASVNFPADFPVAEAVGFLARELDEILPLTFGTGHWQDTPGARLIRWQDREPLTGDWVDVASGVRQCVASVNGLPRTLAFRFDTEAGWTEEGARAWLESRIQTPRCLDLDESHNITSPSVPN